MKALNISNNSSSMIIEKLNKSRKKTLLFILHFYFKTDKKIQPYNLRLKKPIILKTMSRLTLPQSNRPFIVVFENDMKDMQIFKHDMKKYAK